MSAALEVLACGPGTSLQDFGRYGYRRFGVALAGAADRAALARANLLAGNRVDACGIEFTLAGGRFRVQGGPVTVATGDASARLSVDGRPVPPFSSALAADDSVVELSPLTSGIYAYLAVSGGFVSEAEMDSRSMHRRSGIGGASLLPGALLPCGATATPRAMRYTGGTPPVAPASAPTIRFMRGPQDDLFPHGTLEKLLSEPFTVDPRSDRMGCRLTGPKLIEAPIGGMVSDGVVPGSMQVPGEGQPIVLMRDCQTTGGYPKIGTVISVDLDRLAQVRPGSSLHFTEVSLEDALAALEESRRALAAFASALKAADTLHDSETLLSHNLVGGVVNALDQED